MAVVGRIFLTAFLGIFIVAGIAVAVLGVDEGKPVDVSGWQRVPIEVIEPDLRVTDDLWFRPGLRYEYEIAGETFETQAWGPVHWRDAAECQRVMDAFLAAGDLQAWVDPADPETCLLDPRGASGDRWFALLFGSVFAGIPLLILVGVWRSGGSATRGIRARQRRRDRGRLGGQLFFSLFLLVGLGILVGLLVLPLWRMLVASGWQPVPATLHRAEVETRQSDDGATYAVWVHYSFLLDGHRYHGSRAQLSGAATGGRAGKSALVERLQQQEANGSFTVWVDPDDPYHSVVDRAFPAAAWFGLLGLPFMLAGGIGLWFMRRAGRRRRQALVDAQPDRAVAASAAPAALDDLDGDGEIELPSASTAVKKLLGVLFFTLVWNGISWTIFLIFVGKEGWSWFPGLLVALFPLIGLFMLFGALPYSILACFNPRIRLFLPAGAIRLGQRLPLRWSFDRDPHRLDDLVIDLVAQEEATYRRGTNSVTDRQIVHRAVLCDAIAPIAHEGRVDLELPTEAMHSFKASNNKVTWQIRVRGSIASWPDLAVTFPIRVDPDLTGREGA